MWYNKTVMDRKLIKSICIIAVFAAVMVMAVGSIATTRGTSYLVEEIDEKIVATAESFANDLSVEFNHLEGLTDSIVSYFQTTFNLDEYERDPRGYLELCKGDLRTMIKSNLSTIDSHGLYVTFNPEFTDGNDEVWYAYIDGEMEEIFADFEANRREFNLPYEDDMAYFFEPQGKDEGQWVGLYYDEDIDKNVFSYSHAIYVDGAFIGVAGADINAEDHIKDVEEMNLYEGGYSALLDGNYEFIVYPNEQAANEEDEISAALSSATNQDEEQVSGSVSYRAGDTEMIMGYSKLRNGWTFVITQPKDAAYDPIYLLRKTIILLGIILAVSVVAFLIAFTRPFIKKNTTLEEENREKEIMLIDQSRQAKIGEMVGNVTHQWKQPLNTINLIMANLLDSYRYDDLDEKRLEKSVAKVGDIVDKMSETITDFSEFLKPNKKREYFKVIDCINSAVSLMEESINLHRIKIEILCETEQKAFGYQNDTTHVIFNLLNNARDSIISSRLDERLIRVEVSSDDDFIRISVMNIGNYIPDEIIGHIFDPYFTTKEKSGGTGLGLYISRQIVEERMNGKIYVKNTPGGVTGEIFIPVSQGEQYDNE